MSFFLDSPVAMLFVGAHFAWYSLAAWATVLVRAVCGRFSRREWLLFAFFTVALFAEWLQLFVDGFKFSGANTYGLARYFGVYAPLLWIWAAKSLAWLWTACRSRTLPAARRIAAAGCLGIAAVWLGVVAADSYGDLADFYRHSATHDVKVAAERIADTIRADYAGPARQEKGNRVIHDYFSTRRPVVFSFMSAAAWQVRGQAEGANMNRCPYPDDYLFIRVGSGYGSIDRVNPAVYDYVASVEGDGSVWRLFRRKTTPHRLKNKPNTTKGEQK